MPAPPPLNFTSCFPTRRPGRLRRRWKRRSSWWPGPRWLWWGCSCLWSSSPFWSDRWFPEAHQSWCRCSRLARCSPASWSPRRRGLWKLDGEREKWEHFICELEIKRQWNCQKEHNNNAGLWSYTCDHILGVFHCKRRAWVTTYLLFQ